MKPIQKIQMLLCALFLCVLGTVGVLSFVLPDVTELPEENRVAQLPQWSVRSLFAGEYLPRLEAYYTDTFPFRAQLFRANETVSALYHLSFSQDGSAIVGKEDTGLGTGESAAEKPPEKPAVTQPVPEKPLEKPDVKLEIPSVEGKGEINGDGTILLQGDRAMEVFGHSDGETQHYADILNAFRKALPQEVRAFSLLAPTSAEFYSPDSYHSGNRSQKKTLDYLEAHLDPGIIYVDSWSELVQHTEEYLYYRTDHHWTARGAYYAYEAFCKVAGLTPVPLADFQTGEYPEFLGSMYRFLGNDARKSRLKNNPDQVEYFLPIMDTKLTFYPSAAMTGGTDWPVVKTDLTGSNKYLCFICGDNPLTKITTSQTNGKKILVTKESYANAFVPFLTSHYEEIYVVDPRSFNGKDQPAFSLPAFVEEQQIQDVLAINYTFSAQANRYRTQLANLIP